MSKIEKALKKANPQRGLVPVRSESSAKTELASAPGDGRDLVVSRSARAPVSRKASVDAIARMRESSFRGRDELASINIIAQDVGDNPTVQAFRDLRTRVLQHTHGQNAVVMVTSVVAGGGSSFVTANLGVAFAFDAGRTALLVDCNLRNPGMRRLVQEGRAHGITDYLDNPEQDISEIIHPVGIERLRVIPTGTKHDIPAEYFTSARVRELFEGLRNRYAERIILVDAPPMSESADTQILAGLCDYVLLVVPYGKATARQLDSCVKSLDSNKLIGIVFNNEPLLPILDWKALFRESYLLFVNQLKSTLRSFLDAARKK